ncbi:uncharacterized protein LOC127279573 isoform X1 [Leptopilina boulardi]|uniref:uncharacterized protein LOC127279573 isoform X1 n=1 Tax=Leptopilina boulardi TaxID=63433 RepID=UPI0021F66BDA|nr:uncharacterized protein LOC127279573 isoform X1 [Leptopilina boulardi]
MDNLINLAWVQFSNGTDKVVPIGNIQNFVPKNKSDFNSGRKYKVWCLGTKGKEDNLLNGFILLLGSDNDDIDHQKSQKRVKFPNKRRMSLNNSMVKTTETKKAKKESKIMNSSTTITTEILQKAHEIIHRLDDTIDNVYNEKDYAENDNEEDNFFVDALEDNDWFFDAEDESSINETFFSSQQKYSTLDEMINAPEFNTPASATVNKSIGEIILIIIKYALVHSLSFTATFNLFRLINSIFELPIWPNTKYLLDKLFCPKKWITFHANCTQCSEYIGAYETRKTQHVRCEKCQISINVKDYGYNNFFITMDPSFPISQLLETNSDYYNFVVKERKGKENCFNDIYDGKLYRKFVDSLSENDKQILQPKELNVFLTVSKV